MNFSHIDNRLTLAQVQAGKSRMAWLLTELAIRDDNQHVGTGLGGNNFQLLALTNFKHTLVKRDIDIHVSNNHIAWGAPWFLRVTRATIRLKLDQVFTQIIEKNKVTALAIQSLATSNFLRESIAEYREHFPELSKALDKKRYVHNPNLSTLEQMIAACTLCQDLARELDNGETKSIPIIGAALLNFSSDILVYSIRKHIKIERIVRFNLDEDPVFLKIVDKANAVIGL